MKNLFNNFDWVIFIAVFVGGIGIVSFITFLILALENESVAYFVGMLLPALCFAVAAGLLTTWS